MTSKANCMRKTIIEHGSYKVPPSRCLKLSPRWKASCCCFKTEHRARSATLSAVKPIPNSRSNALEAPLLRPRRQPGPSLTGQSVVQVELAKAISVVDASTIPVEDDLLKSLATCERLARSICKQLEPSKESGRLVKTPTSNLLNLEEHRGRQAPFRPSKTSLQGSWKDNIEDTAYRIVTDAKTFITPKILKLYVEIVATLDRPQTLPEIFDLYAAKPIPIADTSPIIFREPEPTSFKAAIPVKIARRALDAAIESRNLALCLNVVSTTVGTSAFRRNKVLRRVSLPAFAFCLTPWASYEMAIAYMEHSPRTDPDYAFYYPFLAFMTFFSMTSLTAYIAITASAMKNRVTWRMGTALYQKWTREDERAFADEIAQAWGFQEYHKRGEEEGRDWENLRQWLWDRRMDLDRPELMEGME